ncbi:unnamed protein product, partial [Cladocopium goreaui]
MPVLLQAVTFVEPDEDETLVYTAVGIHAQHRQTLVRDASDWIEIHGETPWTKLPAFDPWRIYPDVLHVLDLAIAPDSIGSFLLFATDNGNRDQGLDTIRMQYFQWASEIKLGCEYLANPKLFTSK